MRRVLCLDPRFGPFHLSLVFTGREPRPHLQLTVGGLTGPWMSLTKCQDRKFRKLSPNTTTIGIKVTKCSERIIE